MSAMDHPMASSVPMECPKCQAVHDPDHCDGHARSGAQCGKVHGHGTGHKGFGNCSSHGGSSESGHKHAAKIQDRARLALVMTAEQAVRHIVAVMSDTTAPHRVRLSAAQDILDRAGIVPPRRVEHTGPDGGPIPVEVRQAELLERARQLRDGSIIDTVLADDGDDEG